jgi:hypothetical protein
MGFSLVLPVHAVDKPVTLEQTWEIIQQQQQEIEQLKRQVEQTQQKLEETDEKVEATSSMIEESGVSTTAAWSEKSQFGAYGELHYNNLQNDKVGGSDKKEIDFHRFVLFFGHKFNEKIRFFSELELEHSISGEGQTGEIELEQAYIDFDITEQLTARGGLFILPIGILNETHEPTTFYGVERNPVEKNIIPVTWWEGGAGLIGKPLPGLQYDLAIHSGLDVGNGGVYNVRKGRQKVGKAKADNLAFTGRLKYTGVRGLELAISLQYQDDITQGTDPLAGKAWLWEAHAIYSIQQFMLKALYASWDLDGEGPKAAGKDEQFGWYVEPSYKFNQEFGVFARYNFWDNSANSNIDTEYQQVDVGINYWPHPNVVLKFDYQKQDTPDGANEFDGFVRHVGG